ncbi:MAG: F0F1 ATP synthase subunit alpha, partial [Armatimonadota bacterium]
MSELRDRKLELNGRELRDVLDDVAEALEQALGPRRAPIVEEVGVCTQIGHGIARVRGLPGVRFEELLRFPGGLMGMAFTLEEDEVGVILLGESEELSSGDEVRRTGRV